MIFLHRQTYVTHHQQQWDPLVHTRPCLWKIKNRSMKYFVSDCSIRLNTALMYFTSSILLTHHIFYLIQFSSKSNFSRQSWHLILFHLDVLISSLVSQNHKSNLKKVFIFFLFIHLFFIRANSSSRILILQRKSLVPMIAEVALCQRDRGLEIKGFLLIVVSSNSSNPETKIPKIRKSKSPTKQESHNYLLQQ